MKTKKNIHIIFILLVGIIGFFACSKKSDNPVAPTAPTTELKITLNGGGFSNQQITFNTGIGGYAINENITYAQFLTTKSGDTLICFISYSGKQTGNQVWNPANTPVFTGVLLYKSGNSGTTVFIPSSGSTNITNYGNVGNFISGTFDGTLQDTSSQNISISGRFSVQRSEDIQTIGGGESSIISLKQKIK
ncbi:MAG: hypothetical protein ACUVRG_08625 [Ignavibacterium sp.]|uniref:hypothetical protein n=1 Tax=Ignavibacterium sp. TaxID=2651167 RepID=UPI00404A8A26